MASPGKAGMEGLAVQHQDPPGLPGISRSFSLAGPLLTEGPSREAGLSANAHQSANPDFLIVFARHCHQAPLSSNNPFELTVASTHPVQLKAIGFQDAYDIPHLHGIDYPSPKLKYNDSLHAIRTPNIRGDCRSIRLSTRFNPHGQP